MWRSATAVLGVMVVAAATGCGAAVFECASAEDCVGGRAEGMCQPDGFCSFADAACPSGQRYGENAPSGIANECVGLDTGSTGDSSSDTLASTTTTDGASMTSTSASTTTTTDGTSTTTTGPMMSTTTTDSMTTDSMTTDSMTTSDPVTTATMSDSDTMVDPVCGDGVVDPDTEECDGEDFGGLDCAAFGYDEGKLACDGCSVSTADCMDCMMGCGETCSEQNDCHDAQSCVIGAGELIGSCWTTCMDDTDCAMRSMGSVCFLLEEGPACLFPCGMADVCPDGLECTALQNMDLACL